MGLNELLADYIPNIWIRSGAIIGLSVVAAFLSAWIIKRVCALAAHTDTDLDDQIGAIVQGPVFWSCILFGVSYALEPLGMQDSAIETVRTIAFTISVLIWGFALARMSRVILRFLANRGHQTGLVQLRTLPLFENLNMMLIIAASSYMILVAWNVDITAWLASAGILGIAIGFAARDSLSNIFSGIFIIADAPYKIGDYILLDTGERGQVTDIGLRSTRILTRDDVEVTIPNAVMGSSKISNEAGGRHVKTRIRVPVGVSYSSDIDKVQDILMRVANAEEKLAKQPEARVRFRAFGDSSLDFELLGWINHPVDKGVTVHQLHCAIFKAFQKEGIEIPFPQRDLYLKETPDARNAPEQAP